LTLKFFLEYSAAVIKTSAFVSTIVIAFGAGCASHMPAGPQAAGEPGMLLVPAGRFTMGRDKGEINERPAHTVEVDTFALDRTEVAAADFAAFLNAVGNAGNTYFTSDEYATVIVAPAREAEQRVRFSARPGYERYPANNVSWLGADAYCRWRGKRLPTEAEWEKAARATDERPFPWGKRDPEVRLAQFEQVWQEKQFDVLMPVDAFPEGASPYGMLNMAGNVLEWVSDWYRQNLCDFCNPDGERNLDLVRQLTGREGDSADDAGKGDAQVAADAQLGAARKRQTPPRNNPGGPSTGSFKVLRGGSWSDREKDDVATTRRFWLDPSQRFPHTGFRCSKGSSGLP
jgi:formylglycine-generating enzyme required for sulfatase activity